MKNVFLFIGLLFFSYKIYPQHIITDQLPAVKTVIGDTIKARYLNDLSWNAIYTGKYDSAYYYIAQSLKMASAIHYKKGIASCYNTMASIAKHKGNLNQAQEYYFMALKLLKGLNNKRGVSMVLGGIGLNYLTMGKMPEALDYSIKALKISEEIKDSLGVATDLSNIAIIYREQKKYSEALKYFARGLKIFELRKDTMRLASVYEGIGLVYSAQEKNDKALEYYRKGLFFSKRAEDPSIEASLYTNMGSIYIDQEKLDSGLINQLNALKIYEEIGNEEGMIPCFANIGNIYHRQSKLKDALDYIRRGNALAIKIGSLQYIEETERILSRIYNQEHNYKEAYEHHLKYIAARDSIYNEDNTKKLLRTEMNYEFEKKQNAIKQEQIKKEVETEAIHKRQQIIIWAVTGLSLLLLVIAFLVMRQFRYKNKEREILLEQKLLRSQMNPHFIFNSLQAIQNFILKHNEKDAVKYLGSFASIARSVLENSRLELIPLRKEVSLLGNYLQLQKLRFGNKFDYDIQVDEQMDLDDISIPPMLSQPFIENALEHGMGNISEGGMINVSFWVKDNCLLMEIKDNGNGINSEKSREKSHTSLATTITKERIELMNRKKNSKIMFSIAEAYPGEERKGVKVSFSIPMHNIAMS